MSEKVRVDWKIPGPGDFIFVPPYVPHQEMNASSDETLDAQSKE